MDRKTPTIASWTVLVQGETFRGEALLIDADTPHPTGDILLIKVGVRTQYNMQLYTEIVSRQGLEDYLSWLLHKAVGSMDWSKGRVTKNIKKTATGTAYTVENEGCVAPYNGVWISRAFFHKDPELF